MMCCTSAFSKSLFPGIYVPIRHRDANIMYSPFNDTTHHSPHQWHASVVSRRNRYFSAVPSRYFLIDQESPCILLLESLVLHGIRRLPKIPSFADPSFPFLIHRSSFSHSIHLRSRTRFVLPLSLPNLILRPNPITQSKEPRSNLQPISKHPNSPFNWKTYTLKRFMLRISLLTPIQEQYTIYRYNCQSISPVLLLPFPPLSTSPLSSSLQPHPQPPTNLQRKEKPTNNTPQLHRLNKLRPSRPRPL